MSCFVLRSGLEFGLVGHVWGSHHGLGVHGAGVVMGEGAACGRVHHFERRAGEDESRWGR